MAKSKALVAENPLLLRFNRLMDAFAKSDDERDFYLDRTEGFILYADLDKGLAELDGLYAEIEAHPHRYCKIPKMTFYETKKFMEGFIHEKIYDIDTKEKLLDIIQSKEARENFLEFVYDHLAELEKWQLYYAERMRIRIIEWLKTQEFQFVFEEDLELPRVLVEKLKKHIFDSKVPKDVAAARDILFAKSKTYYSSEALNPRPKRGRPPKQQVKVELEPQLAGDLYTTVPLPCCTFLYLPEIATTASVTFSARYDTEAQLLASLRGHSRVKVDTKLEALSQRLESLRHLSAKLSGLGGVSAEEGKLLKAVSQQSADHESKGGFIGRIKGLLPGRREKSLEKDKTAAQPAVKKVTPINYKKKP